MRRFALVLPAVLLAIGVVPFGPSSATALDTGGGVRQFEGVPPLGTVFVIVGENTSRSKITPQHAPFLTGTIERESAWVENYYALADGSLANYIGMTSGQYRRCEVLNENPWNCHQKIPSIFTQLDAAGMPWTEWTESATNACDFFDSGSAWSRNIYTTHHNPAVYYDRIEGGVYDEAVRPKAECISDVLPMGTTAPNDTRSFDAALAAGDVGRYNLVIPNDCEQGHDPCGTHDRIRQFDSFLQREVPKIEASPAFGPHSAIFITWDEGNDPPVPNRFNVLLAVVGPQVVPGHYNTGPRYTHYSLLGTIEAGFDLRPLGAAAKARILRSIWR